MSVQSKSRWSFVTESRVWRSFFRHGWPDNPLDRSLVMTSNIFFHLHPVKVSRKSLRWSYSFGLGVITIILFGVLTFTGIVEMFYYVPAITQAYTTLKQIQLSVPLGEFTRDMHRWSAHAMVLVVILHMARVFYTGAYKPPREFNWVVGVILLLLTLARVSPATCCPGISFLSGRSRLARISRDTHLCWDRPFVRSCWAVPTWDKMR